MWVFISVDVGALKSVVGWDDPIQMITRGYNKRDPSPSGVALELFMRPNHDGSPVDESDFYNAIGEAVSRNRIDWLAFENEGDPKSTWVVDVHLLDKFIAKLNPATLTPIGNSGAIRFKPQIGIGRRYYAAEGSTDTNFVSLTCEFRPIPPKAPESMETPGPINEVAPPSIADSLENFRKDHPDEVKCGFIMMQFGRSPAHEAIAQSIRTTLKAYGLKALRADDKDYHDDLFPNIQTYLHGCAFGIAVFERIEGERFNPNVALEVGYLMAMGKPVCLLKDQTLTALHTDMVGKLYKPFDTQNSSDTIRPQLEKWLADKGIIPAFLL